MTGFSFIHVAAWSQHRNPSPSPRPTFGHLRSLSSISPSAISNRSKSPAKSHSSTNAADVAMSLDPSSLSAPRLHKRMPSSQSLLSDQDHSTIPDPRLRPPSRNDGTEDTSHTQHTQHPDLDHEVATLSTKLINALNHQTTLDDTLSAARQELEASHARIRDLEQVVAQQQETLSGDVWVKRSSVEEEKNKLLKRLIDEKRQRAEVEKGKRKIEQELETLTVSLFEEANRMVITAKEDAKKESEALRRKNELLKAQLADTEGLLRSQQEQLTELKHVMEQMTVERDSHIGTAPSSPGFSKFESKDDDVRTCDETSHYSHGEPLSPTHPTSFTHLLHPVLRTDIASYDDFMALVKTSKKQSPSRVSSGSYSGLNPLAGFTGSGSGSAPSNASTASISTAATPASSNNVSPQTPNTPNSALSAGSAALPPLKDSKFYKRVLAEDIEPTLRLDTAPGLSWLARRSVLSAMSEGTLVVEPVPTNSPFASISKPQFYACSLCGEMRKDKEHLRNHRFRTSESDSAQRYPLCKYCLGRVRSTCDFLGFLRMVKDGHWRAEDADAERAAWEESVKLREQMFWSRIGGGVVPAHANPPPVEKSVRNSHETSRPSAEDGAAEEEVAVESAVASVVASRRPSVASTDGALPEPPRTPQIPEPPRTPQIQAAMAEEPEADVDVSPSSSSQAPPKIRHKTSYSVQSLDPPKVRSEKDWSSRLSLSIPGSFF